MYHLETPTPLNPLGVKGVGEAGCIATAATIASGLTDALREFGNPKFRSTPITPSMIHEVISSGSSGWEGLDPVGEKLFKILNKKVNNFVVWKKGGKYEKFF